MVWANTPLCRRYPNDGMNKYWGTKIVLNVFYTEVSFVYDSLKRKPRKPYFTPPIGCDTFRVVVYDRETEKGYSDSMGYWTDDIVPINPFKERTKPYLHSYQYIKRPC